MKGKPAFEPKEEKLRGEGHPSDRSPAPEPPFTYQRPSGFPRSRLFLLVVQIIFTGWPNYLDQFSTGGVVDGEQQPQI